MIQKSSPEKKFAPSAFRDTSQPQIFSLLVGWIKVAVKRLQLLTRELVISWGVDYIIRDTAIRFLSNTKITQRTGMQATWMCGFRIPRLLLSFIATEAEIYRGRGNHPLKTTSSFLPRRFGVARQQIQYAQNLLPDIQCYASFIDGLMAPSPTHWGNV